MIPDGLLDFSLLIRVSMVTSRSVCAWIMDCVFPQWLRDYLTIESDEAIACKKSPYRQGNDNE